MDLFSSPCLLLSVLFFLLPLICSTTITIPLSHFDPNASPDHKYERLSRLVSASLARARHLKNPQTGKGKAAAPTTTALSSHSYGGYSVSLSFGTPPQTIPFIMDTGSDLVWFPCTRRYRCNSCNNQTPVPSFIPKLSSTSKVVGCQNPKCSWIHSSDAKSRCTDCDSDSDSGSVSSNCTQICPPYMLLYGSGATGGIVLSETLDLPRLKVPEFLVGCSVFSSRQPAGIAGFGRGQPSLPSQLGLKKFSYCLLSHRFDDSKKSSSMLLDGESDSGAKTAGLSYTRFLPNPRIDSKQAFSVYYYIGLRQIAVGGRRVKVPYKYLKPDSDGNGGTIIDSGTTFTFMAPEVYKLVAAEFESQVKKYKRAHEAEELSGLRPCFHVPDSGNVTLPELTLHFKGGAEMALPVENYFALAGDDGSVCFTVVTDGDASGGPGIILGNFQTQNFHVEYDLRNERLGFRQQTC